MKNGYNNAAFFYDSLSRLVFGNTLLQAKASLLPLISPNSKILIAGGGSGAILEAICRQHPAGLYITFVDAASRMVARARKRNVENNQVDFIVLPVEEIRLPDKYDVIITQFFFDNFREQDAIGIFRHLHYFMKTGGLWLYTDFTNNAPLQHRMLLKAMYVFFKMICGVPGSHVPAMDALFTEHGYTLRSRESRMSGFIESKAWHYYIKSAT